MQHLCETLPSKVYHRERSKPVIYQQYVGLSAAMEIGFATAQKCPVFSRTAPQDIALRGLVKVVPSVYDVLCVVGLR